MNISEESILILLATFLELSVVTCGNIHTEVNVVRMKEGDLITKTSDGKLNCSYIARSFVEEKSCKCLSNTTVFHIFPNKTFGCYNFQETFRGQLFSI